MFEKEKLDIPCPSCGAKNPVKVGDIETISHVTCIGCQEKIEIEGKEFGREIRKINKAVSDFEKAISDINKRNKRR